jgi:hypothetical protein
VEELVAFHKLINKDMGPNIKSRLIDTIKGKIEQDLRSRFEN